MIEQAVIAWEPTLRALGGEVPSARSIIELLRPLAERIVPQLAETSRMVYDGDPGQARACSLEGAQGTLLDIDHGTYPYVTSSPHRLPGAAAGSGIGPTQHRLRCSASPRPTRPAWAKGRFPPSCSDATGDKLREDGVEFGSVTGRPRRTGWLDLPALRYAARINGLDGLAVTKLDVLTGHRELKVCVAYDTPQGRTDELPLDLLDEPWRVTPIYETFEGWSESLAEVRSSMSSRARPATTCISSSKSQGSRCTSSRSAPAAAKRWILKNPFLA